MNKRIQALLVSVLAMSSALAATEPSATRYSDQPYLQDYARKYPATQPDLQLRQVSSDRNGVIQVRTVTGLLRPDGHTLAPDLYYRPLTDMTIVGLKKYRGQFVYLTNEVLLGNAWAGKYRVPHGMPDASHFALGDDFSALVAGPSGLKYFEESKLQWQQAMGQLTPLQISYDESNQQFLLLTSTDLYRFSPLDKTLETVFSSEGMTAILRFQEKIIVATTDGYLTLDAGTFNVRDALERRLPWTEITSLGEVNGQLWFGTTRGAFTSRPEGGYAYYASKRWLLDDNIVDIQPGPEGSVLILSKSGLNQISYRQMTLADKAAYFEKIQRQRHIRYGFSSELNLSVPGDLSSGTLIDTDNDGLWTSMYLAAELFRYAVTKSDDALANAYEAFDAMEHLDFINPIAGFPSRTFEREGYPFSDIVLDDDGEQIWRLTEDGNWRWKSTTSSDESIGHFFVYALFAEIVPDADYKARAVAQITRQMDHIIDNDWYLVTWNGKPTEWGRWNPDYVNSFPTNVGDRRLNSTLILNFLQTAYHFSGDSRYREKAEMLINEYGYLENTLRPATAIGFVEGELLSDVWNHSDDEMYFMATPGLYKYAFDKKAQKEYLKTISSHWQLERGEKSALWNFLYTLSGGPIQELDASIWWLKEFPLDLVNWSVSNSHRKDLTFLQPNFRGQTVAEILPPDERPMHLHNGPSYEIDADSGGRLERPPYVYLLPYWMGRYIGAIAAP